MVQPAWESEFQRIVNEDLIGYGFCSLVSCGICLCKPGEMIQDY